MNPLTRRAFLHRGLGLSFGLATLLRTTRVPEVAADKKKPKKPTVAERTDNQRDICETADPPGKLAVLDGPNGGNTTECKGGAHDGFTCINTKKATTCWQAREDLLTTPGGDGAVPPSAGNEDPTDGGGPPLGGGVDPSGGNEQPGGGVTITAYNGNRQHGKAKRRGTHGTGHKRRR